MTTEIRTRVKPAPQPTPEAQTFWAKAAIGELWLPYCDETGKAFFPPRLRSPFTGGAVTWRRVSGRAQLASYVIVHRPAPGFEEKTPYVIAIAALEEGPHLLTNLPGAAIHPDALRIGVPLEVTFEPRGEVAIPQFRLTASLA